MHSLDQNSGNQISATLHQLPVYYQSALLHFLPDAWLAQALVLASFFLVVLWWMHIPAYHSAVWFTSPLGLRRVNMH